MTCSQCKHQFCWLCNGDWNEHGEKTGGFYKCNKFEGLSQDEKTKKKSEIDKEKSLLEKFIFYYDRFNNNEKSE